MRSVRADAGVQQVQGDGSGRVGIGYLQLRLGRWLRRWWQELRGRNGVKICVAKSRHVK